LPTGQYGYVTSFSREGSFGLFFRIVLATIAHMAMLTRSLALLCSLLLTLPPGWCCITSLAPCCNQHQPAQEPEAPSAPVKHKSCCHHQSTQQKCNDPSPAPKPISPGKVCACEKAPLALNEVARPVLDLLVTPLATLADLSLAKPSAQSELSRIFNPSSSRLYISHCVWLC
jgi:hypothetical protein